MRRRFGLVFALLWFSCASQAAAQSCNPGNRYDSEACAATTCLRVSGNCGPMEASCIDRSYIEESTDLPPGPWCDLCTDSVGRCASSFNPCNNDSACRVDETCVDGKCQNLPCFTNSQCRFEKFCSTLGTCAECVEDGDCNFGPLGRRGPPLPPFCVEGICVECSDNADCASSVCIDNVCVECRSDGDCAGVQLCRAGTCTPVECLWDGDCPPNLLPICGPDHRCVQCDHDVHCPSGFRCTDSSFCEPICNEGEEWVQCSHTSLWGACVGPSTFAPACTTHSDCPLMVDGSFSCCEGRCVFSCVGPRCDMEIDPHVEIDPTLLPTDPTDLGLPPPEPTGPIPPEPGPPSPRVEVIYLANEGFLLRAGKRKVLIDAVFGRGLEGYPHLGPDLRRELQRGEEPFDYIDLVLATHHHSDHFDAQAVARFLANHPESRFVSTKQAMAELERVVPASSPLRKQIRAVDPSAGKAESLKVDGISLEVFNLPHRLGEKEVEDLGFLVDLYGVTVLHVGDAEVTAEEYRASGLAARRVDIALLTPWTIGSLVKAVSAERIVVMHLPEWDAPESHFRGSGSLEGLIRSVREVVPEAIILRKPMASLPFVGRR